MIYYVIQVKPRGEQAFLDMAREKLRELSIELLWPRRALKIKRRGRWLDTQAPIFPGYLFLLADSVNSELFWLLRRTPGFVRFLKSNNSIDPLPAEETSLLSRIIQKGEIVKKSLVKFDENNRIIVVDGPLKGLEGRIVKVDRRKERAKVKLDLYAQSFLIDFGFEILSLQSPK